MAGRQSTYRKREEEIFSGWLKWFVIRQILGDLGIAPGHAPLITDLTPGPIRVIKQGGEAEVIYVSGGFLKSSRTW